jgi:hypothetical protein
VSLYIDEKYAVSISHLLRNFKKKENHLYNFSCPICGDSKKNKLKSRGYLYRGKDRLRYKCHNCDCSISFGDLIKQLDESLYKEYIYESFLTKDNKEPTPPKENPTTKFKKKSEYKPTKPDILIGCPTIASLPSDHPARAYLEWRKLPIESFREFCWTDDFSVIADILCPDHKFNLRKEGRILIPFLDRRLQLLALQGRSQPTYNAKLDMWVDAPNAMRYITLKAYEDAPRIFGMNRLAKTYKRIYTVEGPFDSYFVPNCVALAGSDIPIGFPTDKTVIIYDNECRNKAICDKIEKAIERGYMVCIWPDNIKEKDINKMIQNGYKQDKIREIIDTNVYVGLEAKAKLQHWRKN